MPLTPAAVSAAIRCVTADIVFGIKALKPAAASAVPPTAPSPIFCPVDSEPVLGIAAIPRPLLPPPLPVIPNNPAALEANP